MEIPRAVFFTALTAASVPTLSEAVHAQSYPARNITLIVPYPAGGGTDLFARVIAQDMSKQFERQIVIDNRSGANGNIGAELVAKSVPDGHTLLYTASPIALSRVLSKNVRFYAQRDLRPISMTISIPLVLAVHPSFLVPPLVQPHVGSGKLRPIAVSSRTRSSVFPNVPTAQEQGLRDFEALQWHSFFAPSATPDAVIKQLHAAVVKALGSADVSSRLAAEGAVVVGNSPAEFAAFFQSEISKWTAIAKRAGIQAE